MQLIGFLVSLALVLSGIYVFNGAETLVYLMLQYPKIVGIGVVMVGIVLALVTEKYGRYKLSAESKEIVLSNEIGPLEGDREE